MTETIKRPREVIARCHAERDQYGGEIADRIVAELESSGFVIVPVAQAEAILKVAANTWRDAALALIVTVTAIFVILTFGATLWQE